MPEYDNCCLSRFTAAFTPIIVLLWPGFVRAGLPPCYQVSTSTQNIGQQLVRMSPSSLSPPQVLTDTCKIYILVIGSNFRDVILVRISVPTPLLPHVLSDSLSCPITCKHLLTGL